MHFTDHTYAVKHGVTLRLRLWPSPTPGPWLFWIHGGAWLFGLHEEVTPWIVPGFLSRGYTVVSVSYRLAPIVNIGDMLQDLNDGYTWLRGHLSSLVPGIEIDAWAIGGDSAGGTLSTLLATEVFPSPRAVLNDHGLIDLTDPYFDSNAEKEHLSGEFSAEEIESGIVERDPRLAISGCIAPSGVDAGETAVMLRKRLEAPYLQVGRRERLQVDIKKTLFANSKWVRAALHADGDLELTSVALRFSAVNRVDKSYPPTFFIHGEEDDCVPVAQSRAMAVKLRSCGVPVGEYYESGVGHVFDQKFTSPEVEGYDLCCGAAMDFIVTHVGRTRE